MKINELKKKIVLAAHKTGSGHIPSAFSILDIIWVLYDEIMLSDDRFVLSKGHGCLALYAVLEEKGLIPAGTLNTFAQHGSILGGHPDRNKVPGVLCSTGSLGHGLGQAVGMALAKKIKKEPGEVICLVGDGELNEGSCWEACLLASQHNLTNLRILVDYNHSTDRAIDINPLTLKFQSFGFRSGELDGHDHSEIKRIFGVLDRPQATVLLTVKGNGCERMQYPDWHHRAPDEDELAEILDELE